jgi:hypothetical protein
LARLSEKIVEVLDRLALPAKLGQSHKLNPRVFIQIADAPVQCLEHRAIFAVFKD